MAWDVRTGASRDTRWFRLTGFSVGEAPEANRVNVLYEDRSGRLWAGTDGGLFFLEESSNLRRFVRFRSIFPRGPIVPYRSGPSLGIATAASGLARRGDWCGG